LQFFLVLPPFVLILALWEWGWYLLAPLYKRLFLMPRLYWGLPRSPQTAGRWLRRHLVLSHGFKSFVLTLLVLSLSLIFVYPNLVLPFLVLIAVMLLNPEVEPEGIVRFVHLISDDVISLYVVFAILFVLFGLHRFISRWYHKYTREGLAHRMACLAGILPRFATAAGAGRRAADQATVLAASLSQRQVMMDFLLTALWLQKGYEVPPQALASLRHSPNARGLPELKREAEATSRVDRLLQDGETGQGLKIACLGSPIAPEREAALASPPAQGARPAAAWLTSATLACAVRLAHPRAFPLLARLDPVGELLSAQTLKTWLRPGNAIDQESALRLAYHRQEAALSREAASLLDSATEPTAQIAAQYWGQYGQTSQIPLLLARLAREDLTADRFGALAQALVQHRCKGLAPHLQRGLAHEDSAYRANAAQLLVQAAIYDAEAAAQLAEHLQSPELAEDLRLQLLKALRDHGHPRSFLPQIQTLSEEASTPKLQAVALQLLKRLAPSEYQQRVGTALQSAYRGIRIQALQTLKQLQDLQLLPALAANLRNSRASATQPANDEHERQLTLAAMQKTLAGNRVTTATPERLYCLACLRYARRFEAPALRAHYWACPSCRDVSSLALVEGQVVGHVGGALKAPAWRDTNYHLPLWDATQRQATAAQVDTLWLYNSALTEPEWAVSAVLQALEQAAPGAEAAPRVWVAAPEVLPLNAQKMLAARQAPAQP
jgi:hypothetical protein